MVRVALAAQSKKGPHNETEMPFFLGALLLGVGGVAFHCSALVLGVSCSVKVAARLASMSVEKEGERASSGIRALALL